MFHFLEDALASREDVTRRVARYDYMHNRENALSRGGDNLSTFFQTG
jgi:hypothetical protein